jgi:hypothetical protein
MGQFSNSFDDINLHKLMKRNTIVLFISVFCLLAATAQAHTQPDTAKHNGQRDFDFEFGVWKTELKRLLHPLTGSTTWVEYTGTTDVSKIWAGAANMVELDVSGPAGRIRALSLRLYNAETGQWSLNFSGLGSGTISQPTMGEFKDGRGEFYDQELLNGRAILVRFIITQINPDKCHFEQAFSPDGGKTWELNWVATDTRVK